MDNPALTLSNEMERDLRTLSKSLNFWVNSKPLMECLSEDKSIVAVLLTILRSLNAMLSNMERSENGEI